MFNKTFYLFIFFNKVNYEFKTSFVHIFWIKLFKEACLSDKTKDNYLKKKIVKFKKYC